MYVHVWVYVDDLQQALLVLVTEQVLGQSVVICARKFQDTASPLKLDPFVNQFEWIAFPWRFTHRHKLVIHGNFLIFHKLAIHKLVKQIPRVIWLSRMFGESSQPFEMSPRGSKQLHLTAQGFSAPTVGCNLLVTLKSPATKEGNVARMMAGNDSNKLFAENDSMNDDSGKDGVVADGAHTSISWSISRVVVSQADARCIYPLRLS